MNNRWTWIRCQRCATYLFLAGALACGSSAEQSVTSSASDAGQHFSSEEVDVNLPQETSGHVYFQGYLADVLGGDSKTAAERYRRVLGSSAQDPALGARAALRLANWSESNRKRRDAMDLAVRASTFAGNICSLKSEADTLRRRIATTVKVQDLEVRGPKAGTQLRDVSPEISAQFLEAEHLLASYHKRRLKPRLEALAASVRGKRSAMERAVRGYREVATSMIPEAIVASEFRIASLYYDFSLSLSFELPRELDPLVARNMRSQLRAELRQVRTKARAAYKRSLAVPPDSQSQEWRAAAALGLASVEDIILLMK